MDMKQVRLSLILWTQEQTGMFDYRTEPINEKFHFQSYSLAFSSPKKNQALYYFIHWSQLDGYKFERRKKFQSQMDLSNAATYKLMGGFQIIFKQEGTRKEKAYLKIIPASMIPIREYSQQRKEKITHFLPYWVVRTIPNAWQLHEQQILKLGRLHLKVEEVRVNGEEQQGQIDPQEILDLDDKKEESTIYSQLQGNKDRRCRICFGPDDEANSGNFLINPCLCKGTIKQIHVNCLREWLDRRLTKLSLESNGQMKVSDKQCCEICKMKLPSRIRKHGQLISLMRYIDDKRFIKLRPINMEMMQTLQNQFYLLFDETNAIQIGRIDTSGLFLSDLSVSREHLVLKIIEQKCFLSDKDSKFGTLVYDNDFEVKLGRRSRAFQIENGVYCFTYS